jgi:ferric-dicitrate binding protein FerR (iron transport regulator)
MTRLEELTLNLADDVLSDAEESELRGLLAENEQARQTHVRILQIEAGLRAQKQPAELSQHVMAELRRERADSMARGVMAQIKTQPSPKWRRNAGSNLLPLRFDARRWRTIARVWLPLAACFVLLVCIGVWLFGPTVGKPVLAEVTGPSISIERGGKLALAATGTSLRDGDILRTSEGASAVIRFAPEQTRITLLPGTEFRLRTLSRGKCFELAEGKLEASVARQRPFRSMTIKTPHAEARVIGTRFTLTVTTNSSLLDVMEGKVRFTRNSDEKSVRVDAGHYAVAAADYQLASLPFTGGLLRVWWSGVEGNTLFNNPRFRNPPDGRETVPDFELVVAETNAFAVRVCGYVHPPVTGNYLFWLEKPPIDFANTGYATLEMSPTEDPSEKVTIAQTAGRGNGMTSLPPYLAVGATTAPPPVPLVAGRRYYIQANLFIKKGKAELSVFWQPPGQERRVLSSEFLSPWEGK